MIKRYSRRTLREDTGLEFMPDKNGRPTVRAIRDTYRSDKTRKGKGSELEIKQITTDPAPKQLELAKAVYKQLKKKGKDQEVAKEFNDTPDLLLKGDGSVVVTPDQSDEGYTISAKEIDNLLDESRKRQIKETEEVYALSVNDFTQDCLDIATYILDCYQLPYSETETYSSAYDGEYAFKIKIVTSNYNIHISFHEEDVYVIAAVCKATGELEAKGAGVGLEAFEQDFSDIMNYICC